MYTLIEHRKVSADTASITFSSIPQTFTDLVIVASARTDRSGQVDDQLQMRFNGSTSGYSERGLFGNGSSTTSFGNSAQTSIRDIIWTTAANATASTFGNGTVYIPNYRSGNQKSVSSDSVTENNGTAASQAIMVGLWSGTDAITSVTLSPLNGTNILQNSSATLYGVTRTSAIGKPKAIGGAITYANGYWVHTFTGSGTFSAQKPLSLEYLVIAGGGGGGASHNSGSGGGGAGGYRSAVVGELSGGASSAEPPISMAAGESYPVIVGAGGTGTPAPPSTGVQSNGTNGSNSVFGTITSLGGGGGGGGNDRFVGSNGGSGGGSMAGRAASSGTTGQGFAGGTVPSAGSLAADNGGGGGGAGALGGNGSSSAGGAGGSGIASSITGAAVARGGGGGGGTRTSTNVGAGGFGGGGQGGGGTSSGNDGPAIISPVAGTANTGGGGGGVGEGLTPINGANGGSGIVIVRYRAD